MTTATITLPKTKYIQLKKQANAYKQFTAHFFEFILQDPINQVIDDFRQTNLYTEEFLQDLEDGLRKSSYAKQHAH